MPTQNAALLNLDHTHCRAICDEIGERLQFIIKPATDIPPRLLDLIGRLAELEKADLPRLAAAPSIVPSTDEMSRATGGILVGVE
ncbi:MAG: hypothetical protein KGK16_03585 [Bradyrhizobium sp.]|uniref:hypothetical protein n=1 Tax=Bradyrhizobium sp. TaxID=376 RepID=UPI002390E337|nr:hypothetical protein [Bradyrhizobium sp.]MDE2329848.1 hypothetical protein [Bradyrhizobium sp.]MDE2604137.1 hypothetical protein [Bradyrhizobium sp.]